MGNFNDLTGQTFGRWKVIKRVGSNKNNKATFLVECECKKKTRKEIVGAVLISNRSKSCGCIRQENKPNYKHGMKGRSLYNIWTGMKKRCNNPTETRYKDYGGRGITYTKEWQNFIPFYEWAMKNGYEEGLSIERIDVNGNYEPSNCEWIERKDQSRNQRRTVRLTFKNVTMVQSEWAIFLAAKDSTIISWRKKDIWEQKFEELLKTKGLEL